MGTTSELLVTARSSLTCSFALTLIVSGCTPQEGADDSTEGAGGADSHLFSEDFEGGLSAWEGGEAEIVEENTWRETDEDDALCFHFVPEGSTTGAMWGGVQNQQDVDTVCLLDLVRRLDLSSASTGTLGLTTYIDGDADALDHVDITVTGFDATGSEEDFEVTPEMDAHELTWDLGNFVGWSEMFGLSLAIRIENNPTLLVGIDNIYVDAE